ncbi:MAG: patatin-like phospholipase family protein [Hyphomicrobiales bacterium]|nr:patatin-like phospholipase family protein [Hyphomicrobiales bacterium]
MKMRGKLGIALGGGAARGWAHIGVLKALRAAGIRPDVIAGTSIGAVAGGCFAAGKLVELEEFARSLTLRGVIRHLDIALPGSGLINGNRLASRLSEHLEPFLIEQLDAKFIAVATELGTGHEIWLNKGPLVRAMRASYALPGLFKPMRVNGRWMMDGAFVNPIPVSACRAMGARYVIAVNLHGGGLSRVTHIPHETEVDDDIPLVETTAEKPARSLNPMSFLRRQFLARKDDAPGISRVMMEAFNITQDRIARSRLAGDPPDLMITPRLDGFGLFDFHRADFAIARGEEAARRYLNEVDLTAFAAA